LSKFLVSLWENCRREINQNNYKKHPIDKRCQETIEHQDEVATDSSFIALVLRILGLSKSHLKANRVRLLVAILFRFRVHFVPNINEKFTVGQKAATNVETEELEQFLWEGSNVLTVPLPEDEP